MGSSKQSLLKLLELMLTLFFHLCLVVNLLWQPEVILIYIKLPDHAGSQTYTTFCVYLPCPTCLIVLSAPLLPILIVFKGDSDRCAALADCDEVRNSGLWWCVMNSTVDCVLLLCVLDVRVLHRKEFVCCQLFQQTVRNTWGMLFWRVCHVILCVYVLSSVQESVWLCVCVCVGRMFVTVKIMIPLLCFLQLLQWTESIATTTINPRSSCVSVCAHTQTCNCHTRALSGWTSRIDRSAIETPVRNLSRFFSLFASTSDS